MVVDVMTYDMLQQFAAHTGELIVYNLSFWSAGAEQFPLGL